MLFLYIHTSDLYYYGIEDWHWGLNSLVKGLVDKWVVIALIQRIGHNALVTDDQDRILPPQCPLHYVTLARHLLCCLSAWN